MVFRACCQPDPAVEGVGVDSIWPSDRSLLVDIRGGKEADRRVLPRRIAERVRTSRAGSRRRRMTQPKAERRPEHAVQAPVPLMDPKRVYAQWGPEAEQALVRILREHAYVKGPEVKGLEEEFAAHTGVKRAVAVDSGTDALYLTLR